MAWINSNVSVRDFYAQGKNQPGTLIEVLSNNRRKQFLIGDINSFYCSADSSKPFEETAIITRYKVIWSKI